MNYNRYTDVFEVWQFVGDGGIIDGDCCLEFRYKERSILLYARTKSFVIDVPNWQICWPV